MVYSSQNLVFTVRIFLHSIIKNSQFLPNQADIQAILPTHELIIFIKFHHDWVKVVNFLFKIIVICLERSLDFPSGQNFLDRTDFKSSQKTCSIAILHISVLWY